MTAVAEDHSQHQDHETDTSLSYEQARDQLADIVRRLEAGNSTLEESLALWERGEKLAAVCEQWLGGVRARLAEATGETTQRADEQDEPHEKNQQR